MANCSTPKTITLAITGASGADYGLRLLQQLIAADCRAFINFPGCTGGDSHGNIPAAPDEFTEQQLFWQTWSGAREDQLHLLARDDWFAPVASGSSSPASMVICPASGGCISAIACGASNNLIERAADVALKERRQLIIVPRETPYSHIHLENMLKLTQMGAVILPASPGFIIKPSCIGDLIDFIVARILAQLGIPQTLLAPWGE